MFFENLSEYRLTKKISAYVYLPNSLKQNKIFLIKRANYYWILAAYSHEILEGSSKGFLRIYWILLV